jgi:uncharacterized membrane protein
MTKYRLEAFSDGVFAIAITILILNIRLPETDKVHLEQALISLAPHFLAYAMSFVIIGLYWIAHHTSFHNVAKVNGAFLWLNMLLLLFISFMPFPAYLLGKYPLEQFPLILYGLTLIAANAMAFNMTWYTCYHPELLTEPFTLKDFRKQFPLYIIINGAYLVAILIASVLPMVSYIIYIAAALVLAFLYARINAK